MTVSRAKYNTQVRSKLSKGYGLRGSHCFERYQPQEDSVPASESYNFKAFVSGIDTAGVVGAERLATLSEESYAAVVNLLPDDSEYAVTNEKDIIESQQLEYHYRAVDFAAPSDEDYEWFESTVKNLPAGKSLIHCAANYRVSAFSSIYAFRNLGWSYTEAKRFISQVWNLEEHTAWNTFVESWIAE